MASTLEEEFDPFAEVEMLSDHPTTDKVGKKTTTNHDDDEDAPVTQRERESSFWPYINDVITSEYTRVSSSIYDKSRDP